MPALDAYGVVRTFLEGDAGDIFAVLTAALGVGVMKAGSVRWSREASGISPREPYVPDVYVELVPRTREEQMIGPGITKRAVVVDARTYSRRHDRPEGATQIDLAEDAQKALVHQYAGTSDHAIVGIDFLGSNALIVTLDETAQSAEYTRSVTRMQFYYREALR